MRSITRYFWLLLLLLAAAAGLLFHAGCSSDDDGGTAPVVEEDPDIGDDNGTIVGPAGGTVTSEGGEVSLVIPAGALDEDVEITIDPVDPLPAGAIAGTVFEFGPAGTEFTEKVALNLNYDPAQLKAGIEEANLHLVQFFGDLWQKSLTAVVDTLANTATDSLEHFSTWGLLEVTMETVTVLDDPQDPSHFYTLVEALAYLEANLPDGEGGLVILATNRAQEVDALSFAYNLQIEVADGYTGTLHGPGMSPLVVNAAGAFNLAGFNIVNEGGLLINTNQNLTLLDNTLPVGTAINVGGVKNAPFPAGDPDFKADADKEGATGGSRIEGNAFGGNLEYYFSSAIGNAFAYETIGNTGPTITASGDGSIGGGATLRFDTNTLQGLYVRTNFGLGAKLEVTNHTNEPEFEVEPQVSGPVEYKIQNNAFASVALGGEGIGEIEMYLRANDIQSGRYFIGVSNFKIDAMNQTFNSLLVTCANLIQLTAFNYQSQSETILGDFTVELLETQDSMVNFYFKDYLVHGDVGLGFSGRTMFDVSEGCKFYGEFRAELRKDIFTLTAVETNFYGRFYFEWDDYRAGAKIEGVGVGYHDEFYFQMPPAAFVFFEFGPGTTFSGGKPMYVGNYDFKSDFSASGAPTSKADGSSITFTDVTFNLDGVSHIDFTKVDAPITFEGCNITQNGGAVALNIDQCNGSITIHDNDFTGAGFGMTECPGPLNITENRLNITAPGGNGIGLGTCGTTTVTDNTITCAAGTGMAFLNGEMTGTTTLTGNAFTASEATLCLFVGTGTTYIDNNSLLDGNITIVQGPLHISGNTISSCFLVDAWPMGGLMNDPVTDNDGLSPDDCITQVDFDGNGCCEYPPQMNQVDQYGDCILCDGVSPASKTVWR